MHTSKVALFFALMAMGGACSSEVRPNEISLRNTVASGGVDLLVQSLSSYPTLDSPMIRSEEDWKFLLEIANGTVSSPAWLNPSTPGYERARFLAIHYLAVDHQDQHFYLNDRQRKSFRAFAREVISSEEATKSDKLQSVRTLAAIGTAVDVGFIEKIGIDSTDSHVVQNAAISLALMCEPAAQSSLTRIAETKAEQMDSVFRERVLKIASDKRSSMCGKN
jgi:hypothetical protein